MGKNKWGRRKKEETSEVKGGIKEKNGRENEIKVGGVKKGNGRRLMLWRRKGNGKSIRD